MRHLSGLFTRGALLTVLVLGGLIAGGCDRKSSPTDDGARHDKPVVVATTTMLADLATQVGGEDIVVRGIMKPGGDPHLYQPTPGDARMIADSQMVITSGLHLEGWIDDLVRNAGGERRVIVASDGVKPISMPGSPGGVDPHFWFDLQAWGVATDNVGAALVELVGADAEAASRIEARRREYREQLGQLDAWARGRLETIPAKQRVLITSHDAFAYFGRAYGVEVVGIQGVSTEQEASQRDVANVIDVVRERGAPAVFVETSVNPQLIEQVARETGVKVAGPLHSDSVGPRGSAAATFVGTFSENVRMVTEALGGVGMAFDGKTARPNREAL